MQNLFQLWTDRLAVGIELFAALIISLAALKAIGLGLARLLVPHATRPTPEQIRLDFGRWLALGLEFLLGADILRTAAAPTWNDIGQLAALATLRTALNYFLEREIRLGEAHEPAVRE
ncbi:DUF1622 domain-containing protein [bacterium]|nr:DUF1622 domain-containing protein [bacterium]